MDAGHDPATLSAMELGLSKEIAMKRYSRYLTSMRSRSSSTPGAGDDDLDKLLNNDIRKKLKIIPENVT